MGVVGDDARHRDERLHVLSAALRAFAEETTDYERLLDVVARTVADVVADGCIVRLLSNDGWLSAVAFHLPLEARVRDTAAAARVRAFMAAPQRVADYAWGARLIETGEAFILPRVDTAHFRTIVTPEVAEVYEAIGIHSMLVVVLRLRGESIGTLSLFRFTATAPPFDDGDREMAQALADHAALAIGNARSYVAERAAREAAERATARFSRLSSQRIVESATVGVWMLDAEDNTTFMNARMANMLGMDVEEAVRTPFAEFFVEDRAVVADRLARRKSGLATAYEQRFRKRDGSVGLLWIESSPMHDDKDRYEGVFGIVTDITERRRTEEALRASEVRYRLMFDNSPLPKWMYDAETLRFLDVNAAAVREYGYAREEFLAMTIKDIRPPEDLPALLEAERGAGITPKFGTWRLLKKSGEIIQVEITKHTFTLDDRVCRIAVGKDVTERMRLEDQLRQSQKMEAIGRLAGGVAHDFNNVLSVILSYGELLLADMKSDDPMRADVEEIRKAGRRAADLTRQLLMFSRQQVLAPKVLDLNEVLTSMDNMLQRILGADVDLVSLPARPLGRVLVDPSSMEQIIMNLVVNARDAMPTGGKLTMETDNVVLDEAYAQAHLGVKAGPHVMLGVTDTGSGMDKATQARVFEPFFTTKAVGKGTGLGLSTVIGIVQQSGGSIWVYSEVGKGTTFKVYLPRVDAAVDVARTAEAPTTLRGSETILLVEDDDQVRAVARDILFKSGYQVIEARNAKEALLHSEKHAGVIHLLLSDVVMPQMSGPELAKRLAPTRPEMKVLCMSGYTDDSIVRHGVLEAHIAYLQKPITPEMLTRRVREVLGT